MSAYRFIDDYYDVIDELRALDTIGVDTEFLREKTFLSQLCLVQLSSTGGILCVDPLRPHDYSEFWETTCTARWVVHSGRQDIEVIYQTSGRMPSDLFDTQVAAGLLGFAPQMGYGNLVDELFNVSLPKSHTRADWSQRPLPAEYLQYAADDVAYLLPALDELQERLERAGRLDWAIEDSRDLLDSSLYEIRPEEAIHRLKGARNFRGRRRSVAAALAGWREQQALERNRPRQWILRDNVLLDLAVRQPGSPAELRRIDGMPPRLAERAGAELVEIIAAADEGTGYRPPGPPDEAQKSLLNELQRIVARCAKELGLAAEIIAPRKVLSAAIMFGDTGGRVFRGWRAELVGDAIRERLPDSTGS